MMFRLEKEFRFEASHQLPFHDGKCRRLHGHSWVGRIIVEGKALSEEKEKAGMLMDFYDLGQLIRPLVEEHLDHWHLNDSLRMESPTSEAIAKWVFDRIEPAVRKISAGRITLKAVQIDETCTSRAIYMKGQ